MNLSTETGESRVNGYLFVLERSLKTFLPQRDRPRRGARDRVAPARADRCRRRRCRTSATALERILAELGPPLRVAQAYSAERTIDEAVATGRVRPDRARRLAARSHHRRLALSRRSACSSATSRRWRFFAIAALKPIFPEQRRLSDTSAAIPVGLGAHFPRSPDVDLRGGYWIIPAALLVRHGHLHRHPARRPALSGMVANAEASVIG